jgi:hypothetical protein
MSNKSVTGYRGYTIEKKLGGYIVTKDGSPSMTSQPSLQFAQSWIDQQHAIHGKPAAVPPDRLELQNVEFRAARALAEALRIHDMVAVVDDDYPEVRHKYESAVNTLIDAFRKNGRVL